MWCERSTATTRCTWSFPDLHRQCDGLTLATQDAATIESVMSTTITTTIEITGDVLPSNRLLYDVYKPLGRCVALVDDKVEREVLRSPWHRVREALVQWQRGRQELERCGAGPLGAKAA